jgi:hypothetical protein
MVPGWEPIFVFHFPVRSYEQFERKVALKATNPTHDLDKQRADLVEARRRGELPGLYASRLIDDGELQRRLAEGDLCEDRRLECFMEEVAAGGAASPHGVGPDLGLGLEMWRAIRASEREAALEAGLRAKRERAAREREERALGRRQAREQRALSQLALVERSRWWRLGRLLSRPRRRPGPTSSA